MSMARKRLGSALAVASLLVACGSGGGGNPGEGPNGTGQDASTPPVADGAAPASDSGGPTPHPDAGGTTGDSGAPAVDAGSSGWPGTFNGPLTCSGPGNYTKNGPGCGKDRWSVKTGSDSAASQIDMTPQLTTALKLVSLTMPTTVTGTPRQPEEMTTYALKDAKLIFARLETDGDYHLVLSDGVHTFIGEIPYPGCVSGGPLACNISRARATVDAQMSLVVNQGSTQNLTVSVVGVSFSDFEHGQYGASPNNLELHPVLAICFGAGCDPTKT
jgi:hypothetical protein